MKINENGRSMIEMLGVLAIMGVLSIGGISGYSKAMAQYRINKTIEHITEISTKLSQFGQQGSSYEGLNVASAIKYKAVPSSTIASDGNSLENVYGGAITIESASITGGIDNVADNMAYIIKFSNISADACLSLATRDWGYTKSSSFIGIGVNGGDLSKSCVSANNDNVACASDKTPMSMSKAVSACNCDSNCSFQIKFM